MELSKQNQGILDAVSKGYKIQNNQIISPKGKILKIRYQEGYPSFQVSLFHYKKRSQRTVNIGVHRYIAYQKFGKVIFNENIVVRHLDGNLKNFSDDNIAIGTQKDNINDRTKESLLNHAILASSAKRKFTDMDVLAIKQDRSNGAKYKDLMQKYNIENKSTLHYIIHNKYITSKIS